MKQNHFLNPNPMIFRLHAVLLFKRTWRLPLSSLQQHLKFFLGWLKTYNYNIILCIFSSKNKCYLFCLWSGSPWLPVTSALPTHLTKQNYNSLPELMVVWYLLSHNRFAGYNGLKNNNLFLKQITALLVSSPQIAICCGSQFKPLLM